MDPLNVDLWTWDVGVTVASPQAYAALICDRVEESWSAGADVVVFPEYAWMGLETFVTDQARLDGVASLFWEQLWPGVQSRLARPGRAVVLGTVPYRTEAGKLRNRAPILCEGRVVYQDKLNLTPWETAFERGDALHLWALRGQTFAVVICLDIEVPEISVALRGRGVDCLLVPSATETVLGVERIGRCASARAVELGCCVGVSQLVGKMTSELVDENVGRLAWLVPSQAAFREALREQVTDGLIEEGFQRLRGVLNPAALRLMRRSWVETNPARLTPEPISVQDVGDQGPASATHTSP